MTNLHSAGLRPLRSDYSPSTFSECVTEPLPAPLDRTSVGLLRTRGGTAADQQHQLDRRLTVSTPHQSADSESKASQRQPPPANRQQREPRAADTSKDTLTGSSSNPTSQPNFRPSSERNEISAYSSDAGNTEHFSQLCRQNHDETDSPKLTSYVESGRFINQQTKKD